MLRITPYQCHMLRTTSYLIPHATNRMIVNPCYIVNNLQFIINGSWLMLNARATAPAGAGSKRFEQILIQAIRIEFPNLGNVIRPMDR